jgi:hypothetical protein
MAGQYRFKDSNGNIVAQISASVGGAIAFSGSVVDFTQANNVILGNVQLAGTASNALLLDGFDSQAFAFTSSIHPFTASIAGTNTFTSSASTRLNLIETITASNVSRLNSLEEKTGSLATTGSNTFIGTQTITGSLYITTDLIVQGSSSLQNITASAVSIGTNLINLNTANPAIRYAGLSIGDSGSIGSSGSFLYDSVQDEMIFVHRGANTTVTSSVVLMGPQTFDNIGGETYPTNNLIQKGTGNEHLVDSCIFDNGTTICAKGNFVGSGTANFIGNVCAPSFVLANGNCITSIRNTGGATIGVLGFASGTDTLFIKGGTSGAAASIQFQDTGGTMATFYNCRLGIGTTTPGTALEVLSRAADADRTLPHNVLTITAEQGNAPYGFFGGAILFKNRSYTSGLVESARIRSVIYDDGAPANCGGGLWFETTPTPGGTLTPSLVLDYQGRLGIGTSCPSSTYGRLTVAGTGISIADDGNAKLQIGRYNASVCNAYIKMGSNACSLRFTNAADTVDVFVIEKCGNIGVGTSSPNIYGLGFTKQFTISNTDSSQYANFTIAGGPNASGGVDFGNQTIRHSGVYGLDGSALGLYTNGSNSGNGLTERLRITSCGKVGINATDPKWLLEICCNSSAGGAGGYPAVTINNPNAAGYSAYYFYKGASQMGGMEISNSTCNILINTLSTLNFQVQGSNKLTITNDTAVFSSSPSGIMGLGTKVHEGTYNVYTGPSCVLTLPINYGSASSVYLFGTLLGNDSMHYAHMMYYYRNDYSGFQGSVINQMSCYNVSTAGQRYTFSIVDPGGTGKSGCPLQINITCAAGPGVGAGSYYTTFKIVVYNI